MNGADKIKEALERNVKAVTLRPGVGQGTAVTKVVLREGLTCEVADGHWTLTASMSEKYGGANSGPNPGVLGRAALGTCIAAGYAMWAARLGLPLASLEVEVQADYDVRGELGVADDVTPGYTAVRYAVRVESPAPEAEVRRVLDIADKYSSWRDMYARAIPLERELIVTRSGD
ncbi:MAG TPA: OsmC family protein [Gemmatimonadaceae bacterium]|nr:OsmC family protein [Gemmatimonadaceae bacterium]